MKTVIRKSILVTLLLGLTAPISAAQGLPASSASSPAPSAATKTSPASPARIASSSAPAIPQKPKLSLLRQAMQEDREKRTKQGIERILRAHNILKQECIEKTLRAFGLDLKTVKVEEDPLTEHLFRSYAVVTGLKTGKLLIKITPWLANYFISIKKRECDMASFVLGHEAFHIVQNHLTKQTFLFWWLSDIQKALNKLFGDPDAMQREKEKEADIESALATGCAQGGIDFFKLDLNPDLEDTQHPSVSQRCAYLQPIADLQAAGKTEREIREQLGLQKA